MNRDDDHSLLQQALQNDGTPTTERLVVFRRLLALAEPPPPSVALARRVFDSRATPLLIGFRGGSETFHIVWETPEAEIEMEASLVDIGGDGRRRGRAWRVVGQLTLKRGVPVGQVVLAARDDDREPARVPIGEDGTFSLETKEGLYDLLVRTNERLVVVPDVELR